MNKIIFQNNLTKIKILENIIIFLNITFILLFNITLNIILFKLNKN